jgi:predicted small secreted protein
MGDAENSITSENEYVVVKSKSHSLTNLQSWILGLIIGIAIGSCLFVFLLLDSDKKHEAELESIQSQRTLSNDEKEQIISSKDAYISYLETILNKSNVYYGGDLKLSFERDSQTSQLFVKDIDVDNIDPSLISKYTKGWGDKKEFEYDEKSGKLVYVGPED